MALSEIAGDGSAFQVVSFVRGHHVYHWTWMPVVGEMLPVKRELTNEHDRFTVAVLKDGDVVGHVPRSLSKTTSFFLRHDGNVVFCEVTGERLNRGVQLGVEVPCVYRFYVARNTWINSRSWWLQSQVLTIHMTN